MPARSPPSRGISASTRPGALQFRRSSASGTRASAPVGQVGAADPLAGVVVAHAPCLPWPVGLGVGGVQLHPCRALRGDEIGGARERGSGARGVRKPRAGREPTTFLTARTRRTSTMTFPVCRGRYVPSASTRSPAPRLRCVTSRAGRSSARFLTRPISAPSRSPTSPSAPRSPAAPATRAGPLGWCRGSSTGGSGRRPRRRRVHRAALPVGVGSQAARGTFDVRGRG